MRLQRIGEETMEPLEMVGNSNRGSEFPARQRAMHCKRQNGVAGCHGRHVPPKQSKLFSSFESFITSVHGTRCSANTRS